MMPDIGDLPGSPNHLWKRQWIWLVDFAPPGGAWGADEKSWMVPFTAREAARLSPPSTLPSMAGLPEGTRAFPRWRERSRCTCAHETPPLRGTVCVSHPKPISWQPLSWPKLIVLRARQPLPCTPWLSCRFTKPRHSNRCTRVVSTRGWCRSCARRLISLYVRRKSQEVPREGDGPRWWSWSVGPGAPSLAQPGRDEGRRQGTLPRRPHFPGGDVRWHRRVLCPAVLGGTAADRGDPAHPAPAWRTDHCCQASVCPSPWAPSCILQSCSAPCWIDT